MEAKEVVLLMVAMFLIFAQIGLVVAILILKPTIDRLARVLEAPLVRLQDSIADLGSTLANSERGTHDALRGFLEVAIRGSNIAQSAAESLAKMSQHIKLSAEEASRAPTDAEVRRREAAHEEMMDEARKILSQQTIGQDVKTFL